MMDLYTWAMPNGRKVCIMLGELALAYAIHQVDLGKEQQFRPEFSAISAYNKIRLSSIEKGLGAFLTSF